MSQRESIFDKDHYTTEICAHQIAFAWHDEIPEGFDETELPRSDEEHVQAMLNKGCHSGELCTIYLDENDNEYELSGWWWIEK